MKRRQGYRHSFLLVAALLLLFPALLLAQGARWRLPIKVQDNGGKSDSIWMGIHPNATYCIDPDTLKGFVDGFQIKEYELPPVPPTGVFDARFQDLLTRTPCLGNGLKYNIQGYIGATQKDTFNVTFQPGAGGYPFTLRWLKTLSYYVDSMRMKDAFGGIIYNVNMMTVDSVVITNPAITSMAVYMFGAKIPPPPPDAPVLSTPADGATGVLLSPTLTWNASATAIYYRVQVSTDSLFSTFFFNDTALGTSKSVSSLAQRTKYFWRVNATNAIATGAFSTVFRFTTLSLVPDAPTLVAPAQGAMGIALSPTLSWTAGAGSDSSRLQVSKDQNFTVTVVDTTLTGVSVVVDPLQNCITYYWRVNGKNASGAGAYSQVRNFTTIFLAPAVPVLALPTDGATAVSLAASLSWTGDVCSRTYRVQVSRDSLFSSFVLNDTALGTTKNLSGLLQRTKYFWRVKALNPTDSSAFTAAFRFTTLLTTPEAPTLVSPAQGATVPARATFTWNSQVSADQFRIQVSKNQNFTTTSADTTVPAATTSLTLGPFDNCVQFYWRVNAKNSAATGPYSGVRNFTVAQDTPAPPTLIVPADNASGIEERPLLTWSGDACTQNFRLQVSADSTFATTIVNQATTDTFYQFSSSLQPLTRYFWRVNAGNTVGTSPYALRRFTTTAIVTPQPPVLVVPADHAIGVSLTVALIWKAASHADSYHLQVAADSLFGTILYSDSTLSDTSKLMGPLESSTKFFWHVAAKNAAGKSAFSSVRSFTTLAVIPAVPVLVSPADTASGVAVTPHFTWNSIRHADYYHIQIARDLAFSVISFQDSLVADTSKDAGPLLSGTTFYWHVAAKNAAGKSSFSSPRRFTTVVVAPLAPSLISPANGAKAVAVQPTLLWNGSFGAQTYRLEVARDALFADLLFDDSTIVPTSLVIGPLAGGKTYYWHVLAKNTAGTSPYTATWSFTTTYSGVPDWLIGLAVSETGPAHDTIYFGVNPHASYGIDPSLGEYELPPKAFGQFDVRWLDNPARPSLLGEGLRVDYLPFSSYTQLDTFRFAFQPGIGSYPFSISWDRILVGALCDSMVITDEFGGFSLRARMDLTSAVSVTNSSISSLLIIQWGAHPMPLGVKPVVVPLPRDYVLFQNYPNPFNPTTAIRYLLPRESSVRLTVFNILGQVVDILLDGAIQQAGDHAVLWKSRVRGDLGSGVYFYRLDAKGTQGGDRTFTEIRKMLLMK